MRFFLSLGSNLGQRRRYLNKAIYLLRSAGVKILKTSSVYKTEPVGFCDQPWFYNQVIEVLTDLNPYELLSLAKQIESELKRPQTRRYGPRTIDIDLLLAERTIIQTRKLAIPHPRMHKRRFVLEPLREIAPGVIHPLTKKNVDTMMEEIRDNSVVIKLKDKVRVRKRHLVEMKRKIR